MRRLHCSGCGTAWTAAEAGPFVPCPNCGCTLNTRLGLTAGLEDRPGLKLSPTLLWEYPTLEQWADHVVEPLRFGGSRPRPAQ
jgi:hypothetical protein